MKIAITGTPGTGKTTVSEELADKGYEVIHLTEYFEKNDIGEEKGGEREVRIGQMNHALGSEDFDENTAIEGHLSHNYPADICIVLRCQPDKLEERLSTRAYSDRKVEENIEAEKIDIVLSEAVNNQETVIEIDTTGKSVEETVEELIEKIKKRENDYGNVDWTKYV